MAGGTRLLRGRAAGLAAAVPEGDLVTFDRDDSGNFVNDRSGSVWNILGEAIDGPAVGRRLEPVTHVDTFWFAWSTYRPGTELVR